MRRLGGWGGDLGRRMKKEGKRGESEEEQGWRGEGDRGAKVGIRKREGSKG